MGERLLTKTKRQRERNGKYRLKEREKDIDR